MIINKIYKYHKDFIRIAKSFLSNKEDSEDIVQDMYILIDRKENENKLTYDDIRYKDSINKYFFYVTIRNMCFQFIKDKKNNVETEESKIECELPNEKEIALNDIFIKIEKIIESWNNYDKTLFEIYMYSGLSLRDISLGTEANQKKRKELKHPRLISATNELSIEAAKRGSGISVTSMFLTIKKCKERLKKELGEDFEDYLNSDYHLI